MIKQERQQISKGADGNYAIELDGKLISEGDAVWVREGADLRRTIAQIIALAKSKPKDPFGALREWVAKTAAPPT